MLGKILKYDVKAQAKSLVPMYLIVIAIALITRIFGLIVGQFPILSTIYGLFVSLCVLSFIGVVLWTMIVTVRHFYNNVLKDEGYLTNTLPVTRNQIILSKEILSIITMAIAIIVLIAGVFIAFYQGGVKDFTDIVKVTIETSGFDLSNFMYLFIIMFITTYISYVQLAFVAMMFGQTSNTNKVMFSIIYAIVIYVILSVLEFVVLGLDYLISPDLMQRLMEANNTVPVFSDLWDFLVLIFVSSIVKNIVTVIVFHILTVFMANRKLNLE